jgi:hypothetical protein
MALTHLNGVDLHPYCTVKLSVNLPIMSTFHLPSLLLAEKLGE